MKFDSWYTDNLVCPRTHSPLNFVKDRLVCREGHEYPVVDGIPVMLLESEEQTMEIAQNSLMRAKGLMIDRRCPDLYLESLGASEEEKDIAAELLNTQTNRIDPVVSVVIAATNGIMFKHLIGRLKEYPVPNIPLPKSNNELFLEVGCHWGRWCIAAARKGYSCVGIDPSLSGIAAARRVANQLNLEIKYVVADGRFLPFSNQSFDVVFSYSVFQHLSENNVKLCLEQIVRVLKDGGKSIIQMPNWFAVRNLYNQLKRRFRKAKNFEVRYWSIQKLMEVFGSVGQTTISVDCFFGLGVQETDLRFMPFCKRVVILLSSLLKNLSRIMPMFCYVADSLYVTSICSIKNNTKKGDIS